MNRKTTPILIMLSVLTLASMACQFMSRAVDIDSKDIPPSQSGNQPTTQAGKTPQTGKQPTAQPVADEPQETRQWAVSASASSAYGEINWSPEQATGEPDVSDCGDNSLAWASQNDNTLEWIELSYDIPVEPTEINIYQSYNPSQVVEVDVISTDGTTYVAWQGQAAPVDYCPDEMSITIELEEKFMTNKVVVIVDQSILGLGWNEIDAVELVGISENGQPSVEQPAIVESPQDMDIPDTYTGWMAGPVYQGYIKVIIGETRADELDDLIGLTGKRSTDSWKPRSDHADTFIFDLGKDNMLAWISVTTEGIVYKKAISANTHPSDFKLDTVNKNTYDQLDTIYKDDQVIPYNVMANIIGHPGFLVEAYIRTDDNMLVETYEWFNANGDYMVGGFYNGRLTGMAGLAFIPK